MASSGMRSAIYVPLLSPGRREKEGGCAVSSDDVNLQNLSVNFEEDRTGRRDRE